MRQHVGWVERLDEDGESYWFPIYFTGVSIVDITAQDESTRQISAIPVLYSEGARIEKEVEHHAVHFNYQAG